MSDEHPELSGYEPGDGRPLRSKHTVTMMRVVVVLALVGLVLPGIVTTWSVAASSAQSACAVWVAYSVAGDSGADARFELFGPGTIGWECYSDGAFGGDRHIVSLGLIPGPPKLPLVPRVPA
jgi:hypothetical protein